MSAYVAVIASLILISGNIGYIKGIIQNSVVPTKSTWIIFSIVTGLNVSSFLTNKFDLVSGAYGITDFFLCLMILTVTLVYSQKSKLSFKSFEKYYLVGAFICVLFWIISDNSFQTNLLVQTLIIIGYIPTIHNILSTKRSSESKLSWTIWSIGGFLSLYPAIEKQNTLAIVYSFRATTMCLLILFLTYKFQKKPD